jgi:hypothetical protein
MAAAFDTRFGKPRWLTGSSALRIARRLRRSGWLLVAPPECFFVIHAEGRFGTGGGPGQGLGSGARPAGDRMNPRATAAGPATGPRPPGAGVSATASACS